MDNLSYYDLLEVPKDFTLKELKASYKRLAKIHHPDITNDCPISEEKFKLISTAYQILLCPIKKQEYDREQSGSFFSEFSFSMNDLYSNTASDIFNDSFNKHKENLEIIDLNISFKESFFGSKKNISFFKTIYCSSCDATGSKDKKLRSCPKCNGRGKNSVKSGFLEAEVDCEFCGGNGTIHLIKCDTCDGTKKIKSKESIEINIPKGISDGDKLKITIDDLNTFYLKLHIENDSDFIKQDENLFKQIDLPLTKAILGTHIDLALFDDTINVEIPKNTKHKDLIIIKDKGFPSINSNSSYGNIVLEINIIYPILNEENLELLYKLDLNLNKS